MEDKIKELKLDKKSLVEYVKCFLMGKKAKEFFTNKQEYNDLIKNTAKKEEY